MKATEQNGLELLSSQINSGILLLDKYIEQQKYCGYDPYDALNSPLFRLPFLKSNKMLRFGAQQFVKRFPLNIRPLLLIPKGVNPVTLGLCIHAYCNLISLFPERKQELEKKIDLLLEHLEKLIPSGFHGACWGYNFDWEARYANIPAFQPTIVATCIVANALYKAVVTLGNKHAEKLMLSSTEFILHDLHRTFDAENNFCFSYSPFDKQVVFNAGMKGAKTLAQAYAITGNESLKATAAGVVKYVMNFQREDGAWFYSTNKGGKWIDNYHTGYILDALDEYIKRCNDHSFDTNLKNGISFYTENFIHNGNIPKFYDKHIYPVDCTAAAQCLLTLTRFGMITLAEEVAEWMIVNMQGKTGNFYFRKYKYYTVKTSFMRWSDAWMLAGLSELLLAKKVLK